MRDRPVVTFGGALLIWLGAGFATDFAVEALEAGTSLQPWVVSGVNAVGAPATRTVEPGAQSHADT